MNTGGAPSNPPAAARRGTAAAVAMVAAALIAYEVVLMRRLTIERWHHFGFLVISVALLGFGASGTALAVFQRRVHDRPLTVLYVLAIALALSLTLMPRLARLIPIAARFIPADLYGQLGWWCLYWLTAFVPFLLGGALLGAALMTAGARVGPIYAANLLGSAAGAAGAIWVLSRLPPEHGLWPSAALTVAAIPLLSTASAPRRLVGGALPATLVVVVELAWPLTLAYDEHKYAAYVQRLVAQGAAQRVASRADPHGYIELYESDRFHDLPFLAPRQRPPAMYSLLVNGDQAGSILRIETPAQAAVLDDTLMAFPYRLIPQPARVLLLGESGGTNVWLARRRGAVQVDVVQPNAAIVALWRQFTPGLLADGAVHVHVDDPRRYVEHVTVGDYDLIQLVTLEGLAVGSAGLRGLAEDHLVTVEGLAAALRRLSPGGALAITRGIQTPPRDNIRLLATLAEALESLGIDRPECHIVQMRDYLGVCTLALKTPLDEDRRQRLRAAQHEFGLTPVWYDGLPPGEVNQPDALDGPPGQAADWLHHAARGIFSPNRASFYDAWLLNVRPACDDRPFFWDFYKRQAVGALRQAYGDLWLTRVEIGRLFLYVALFVGAAAAVAFILLPLALGMRMRVGRGHNARPIAFAGLYFAGIGLGFMALEMAFISRATRYLGDPVVASAAVIGGVLLLSGLGSLAARRLVGNRLWLAPLSVAVLAILLSVAGKWADDHARGWLSLLGGAGAAFLMGIPMPVGLARLDQRAPQMLPWAWGINGVASVIATSAALLVAMTVGYTTVLLLAAGSYALAAGGAIVLVRLTWGAGSQVHDERHAGGHRHQGTD